MLWDRLLPKFWLGSVIAISCRVGKKKRMLNLDLVHRPHPLHSFKSISAHTKGLSFKDSKTSNQKLTFWPPRPRCPTSSIWKTPVHGRPDHITRKIIRNAKYLRSGGCRGSDLRRPVYCRSHWFTHLPFDRMPLMDGPYEYYWRSIKSQSWFVLLLKKESKKIYLKKSINLSFLWLLLDSSLPTFIQSRSDCMNEYIDCLDFYRN